MAGDYHRGEMDIAEQTATFHLVMGLTKWGSLVIAAGILFFSLLFCTQTGFLGSAAYTLVLLVVGFLLLRDKPASADAH
ncbi:aa3-type cytochrome c oxidase subunit IV [Phenylobacterium sp.]|uniref:aa3-type cytochrome c oxidase subunit IV n=1 Tax=Phenylobacterium sp. TaxID=1871053 RepID=UPI00121FA418|nr:aa3-type cytochrome c oxidase subunit IV [Phenylobacterium sp.]TAL34712.1 MAG: aa3-type cytochrome c oxidase subunit IV [Phenylobacterium sp.]